MASYASLAWLKTAMQVTDEADDSPLQLALDAATSLIDQWTGRSFRDEPGATKYFYPTSPTILYLQPDLRAVTSVAIDYRADLSFATTLLPTDYLLYPLQPHPDPGIYHQLRIAPLNASRVWLQDRQIRVVGDWGYVVGGEAPAPIRQACLLQAERLFKRAREAPLGVLQMVSVQQFTRLSQADPDVQALIAPYKAESSMWVAV